MTKKRDEVANDEAGEIIDGSESARQERESARRRALLKAGWALPVVTMVPLPRESAMAQTGPSHSDTVNHSDVTD